MSLSERLFCYFVVKGCWTCQRLARYACDLFHAYLVSAYLVSAMGRRSERWKVSTAWISSTEKFVIDLMFVTACLHLRFSVVFNLSSRKALNLVFKHPFGDTDIP